MLSAIWVLGANLIRSKDAEKRRLAVAASLLILPQVFISIFFGMGAPPDTVAGYAAAATEQEIRYSILIIAGVLIAAGFTLLKEQQKEAGEKLYASLGFTAIMIAVPLFVLNMAYWQTYLVEAYRIFTASALTKRPDWFIPLRSLFGALSAVEVALTYLATAAFALSLKTTGWLKPAACNIYIMISLLGFIVDLVPAWFPQPFVAAAFFVSIPAIPFMMPYYIGVNLLRRVSDTKCT
jgi:hypothetical protein